MAAGSDAVQLDKVSKTYDMGQVQVRALRDVELTIPAGEFAVFLGPSGSGKTTLMNIIGGLDSPTSGRVIVSGHDLTGFSEDQLTAISANRLALIAEDTLPVVTRNRIRTSISPV